MITTVGFVVFLVNWHNNELLSLKRQFLHIPNWINKVKDLTP
jgi:hypothetical protein